MRASGAPPASTVASVIASGQRHLALGQLTPARELGERVRGEVLAAQRGHVGAARAHGAEATQRTAVDPSVERGATSLDCAAEGD